jgi:hypothetical protein
MTEEQVGQYFQRIDKLDSDQPPLFGKMNANQMICHCTDQLRLAIGTKKSTEYGQVDPNEMILLAKSGKSVPTPKGLGQVEGDGTKPTNFENDIKILKEHILSFSKLDDNFSCGSHPYFGQIDKKRWASLMIYHLNHHLGQFNV